MDFFKNASVEPTNRSFFDRASLYKPCPERRGEAHQLFSILIQYFPVSFVSPINEQTTYRMNDDEKRELEKRMADNKPRLLSFIRHRVGFDEEAEDILQDVLFQFFVSLTFSYIR